MRKTHLWARIGTSIVTAAVALLPALPAGAFSLKLPSSVKDAFKTMLAQEGTAPSQPSSPVQFGPMPSGTTSGPVSGSQQFGTQPSGSTGQFSQPSSGQFGANQTGPNQMGPSTGQFGQPQQGSTGQFGQQQQGQFGQMQQGQQQQGQFGSQEKFQEFKEGVGPLRNDLNKMDGMVKDAERRGEKVSPETKEKLQRSQNTVNSIRRSENSEEMQNINMDQLESDTQDLEMERRRLEEEKRNLQQMKRGMMQMEKGLQMFERQIAALAKQKINVPAEVKETIAKIKTVIAAIKAAKTFDEAEEAGMQDLPELFQSLDEFRQQLEMLSRWPQTIQQVTRELKRLDGEVKRAKSTVDRLKRQKIDLTDEYTAFAEAVKKMKDVVGVAQAKAASGSSDAVEEAFELLENEFFGQMEETFQHVQVIQTMANLGRFASDFKRGLAQAQQRINQLKRQKIDTTELQEIYNEAKAKGDEVMALLKAKPVDSEAIQEGLQELENLKQQFEEMADELSGAEEEALPWEQGKSQFQALQLSPDISKLIPQKQAE